MVVLIAYLVLFFGAGALLILVVHWAITAEHARYALGVDAASSVSPVAVTPRRYDQAA